MLSGRLSPAMKWVLTLCFIAAVIGSSAAQQEMTAQAYYQELYRAGALDNFADSYVCFSDKPIPAFFLLADSNGLKQFLIDEKGYDKLSARDRELLDRGYLILRTYWKGVANPREFLDRDTRGEGYGFFEDAKVGKRPYTIRLNVNWKTLRYKKTVEQDGVQVAENAGKCEEVKQGVSQHGVE
jgi:hypothetical protein